MKFIAFIIGAVSFGFLFQALFSGFTPGFGDPEGDIKSLKKEKAIEELLYQEDGFHQITPQSIEDAKKSYGFEIVPMPDPDVLELMPPEKQDRIIRDKLFGERIKLLENRLNRFEEGRFSWWNVVWGVLV